MPRKAIIQDVDDIVQIRQAFEDFYAFCTQLGWGREDIAAWLQMKINVMMETE